MTRILSFAAAVLTGILSGFGIGGGTLLLLWLTLGCGMDQTGAAGVNLLYFAACAIPALRGHLRSGLVDRKAALLCAAGGLPVCAGAALMAGRLDVTLLRRLFGVFLLLLGLRELFAGGAAHNPEKAGQAKDSSGSAHALLPGKTNLSRKKDAAMSVLDRIALALAIVGGINWGLVGIFRFDLVAWIFGGQGAVLARIVYVLVALAALWCIALLFRKDEELAGDAH